MTKEKWIQHIEETEQITRPSISHDSRSWEFAVWEHKQNGCPVCMQRRKTKRANRRKRFFIKTTISGSNT